MKMKRSKFKSCIRWSCLVAALVATVAMAWEGHLRTPRRGQSTSLSGQSDRISQMAAYTAQGRYDDAVRLGLELLKNDPKDEIVYQQIADVYLIRATNDHDQREKWVGIAVSYVERALTFNSRARDTAGVHLFQDARSFELAGDLSVDKKCTYYDRARKLLEDRVPLLQGDQITLAGRTFPLEPLRKENDRVLAGVKDKASKAGCR
jgi:tetratricopeptide (TPR) repeat protein